jgi:hypothetical protein
VTGRDIHSPATRHQVPQNAADRALPDGSRDEHSRQPPFAPSTARASRLSRHQHLAPRLHPTPARTRPVIKCPKTRPIGHFLTGHVINTRASRLSRHQHLAPRQPDSSPNATRHKAPQNACGRALRDGSRHPLPRDPSGSAPRRAGRGTS